MLLTQISPIAILCDIDLATKDRKETWIYITLYDCQKLSKSFPPNILRASSPRNLQRLHITGRRFYMTESSCHQRFYVISLSLSIRIWIKYLIFPDLIVLKTDPLCLFSSWRHAFLPSISTHGSRQNIKRKSHRVCQSLSAPCKTHCKHKRTTRILSYMYYSKIRTT